MDQKNKTTQNKSLKRVRIDQVSKGYTKTRIISKHKKSKLRIMHRANKVSSQMTVHSLSQSQTIIHESNNIHRLLPSNPIIHQDQFSTLSVPRPVSNENMQYGDSSRNHVQNIQLSYQQTIRIKQEPESDNESDINTDVSVQYEQYNEQVVQNYSEKIEENVQYGDSSRNHVLNTQSTSQQTIRIKQEPESDNESDINTDVSVQYEQYNEQVVQNYSEKIEENVQYGDSSRNHVLNTQSTSQQTIRIKQEPESDNESDINTDVSVQYEQYNEQVVQNYSEKIEENVQYGDSSRNHGLNTQSTSQQTIKIKQEPESDNEPDINTRRTRESYNYGRFIEDQLNGFSDNTKEAVQFEFFKILSKAEKGYYE